MYEYVQGTALRFHHWSCMVFGGVGQVGNGIREEEIENLLGV
jgi:hypothetical protein